MSSIQVQTLVGLVTLTHAGPSTWTVTRDSDGATVGRIEQRARGQFSAFTSTDSEVWSGSLEEAARIVGWRSENP